jgi:transposase
MSQPTTSKYTAEFKERAVKLAVESDQAIAQTVRDLGVNENTLHTWIGKYHRAERQEKEGNDEHVYEELKRLRKENARLREEREILKKAAAYFAQQLPCSTPGCKRSARSFRSVVYAGL